MLPLIFVFFAALSALAAAIFVPLWITSKARAEKDHDEELEVVLKNPATRRTILRIEIGGIIIGVAAIIFSVFGLYQAMQQSILARDALKNQKIAAAWQLLAQQGKGSTGKAYAVELLINETSTPLSGLQLGCTSELIEEEMGRREACELPNLFIDMKLFGDSEKRGEIWNSDFSYSHIERSTINNVNFEDVNFNKSLFLDVKFSNSIISASFDGSEIYFSKFKDIVFMRSEFGGSFNEVIIENSALLYVDFKPDTSVIDEDFDISQNIILSNVQIGQVSFENVNLLFSGIHIENPIYTAQENYVFIKGVEYPEGAYSTRSMINISGAVICDQLDDKSKCWSGATPDFFKYAWFYEDNPPKGVELLPYKVELAKPCPRENVTVTNGFISRNGDEDCLDRFF